MREPAGFWRCFGTADMSREEPMPSYSSASIEEALRRIRGEYVEMPGLRLTIDQAQRLWGFDHVRCEALLGILIERRFLRRCRDGSYVRAGSGPYIDQ